VVAYWGKIQVLDILWVWAEKVLTPEDISNKLFLDKDNSERTAWHVAAKKGNTEL
jgi:hypothetical protein